MVPRCEIAPSAFRNAKAKKATLRQVYFAKRTNFREANAGIFCKYAYLELSDSNDSRDRVVSFTRLALVVRFQREMLRYRRSKREIPSEEIARRTRERERERCEKVEKTSETDGFVIRKSKLRLSRTVAVTLGVLREL